MTTTGRPARRHHHQHPPAGTPSGTPPTKSTSQRPILQDPTACQQPALPHHLRSHPPRRTDVLEDPVRNHEPQCRCSTLERPPHDTRVRNGAWTHHPPPPPPEEGDTSPEEPARNVHGGRQMLLRKEVIQPHLPVRLPCYDFVPIASPTFDSSLPQGVGPPASGVTDFRDVTGGVYKARERIHRSVADLRLLATPTSRGRVADPDPN